MTRVVARLDDYAGLRALDVIRDIPWLSCGVETLGLGEVADPEDIVFFAPDPGPSSSGINWPGSFLRTEQTRVRGIQPDWAVGAGFSVAIRPACDLSAPGFAAAVTNVVCDAMKAKPPRSPAALARRRRKQRGRNRHRPYLS